MTVKPSPRAVSVIESLIKRLMSSLGLIEVARVVRQQIAQFYDKGVQEMEIKFNSNYVANPDTLTALSTMTFDNIKGMNDQLANSLRQSLQQAFINGEGVPQLKKRIKDIFETTNARAATIAKTETFRAQNFGKLDAAKASGLKLRKWLLVQEDHRTSSICQAAHEKYGSPEQAIPIDKNFIIKYQGGTISAPAPPLHPNCRTILMIDVVSQRQNA